MSLCCDPIRSTYHHVWSRWPRACRCGVKYSNSGLFVISPTLCLVQNKTPHQRLNCLRCNVVGQSGSSEDKTYLLWFILWRFIQHQMTTFKSLFFPVPKSSVVYLLTLSLFITFTSETTWMTAGRGNNIIHQWGETPWAAAGSTVSVDNDVCLRKVTWTSAEQEEVTE